MPKVRKTAEGVRQVTVVIALGHDQDKLLLVSSRKHPDRWVLPKGGWDEGGETREEAGVREVWEEGGLIVRPLRHLLTILDSRQKSGEGIAKAEYAFYEMQTVEIKDVWPESHERRREWFSIEEARENLKWRGEEMLRGLASCSLNQARH